MTSALESERIRWEYRRYDSHPHCVESVIENDTFVLLAPLRRADVRTVSDGQVLVDGEVCPGMLRLTAPGERVKVSLRSSAEHILIYLPGVHLRKILDGASSRTAGRTSYVDPLLRPDRLVAQAAAASLCIDRFDESCRQLYIDGLAYLMLAQLLAAPSRSDSTRQANCRTLNDQEFDRCCQYADTMMDQKLCLAPWAALFDMTTTDFTKSFRQRTRQSPYAWFMTRRIERAKTLLQDQKTPLAEIAFNMGFCSQSHFTEAFRRRVGCSPARWRAQFGAGS